MIDATEKFLLQKDAVRERLVKYTVRAYEVLPHIENPEILDIGCGSGVPTLTLAEISGGHITAFDIDQESLDRLSRKVEKAGLAGRIEVINLSMKQMRFPDESFDILLSEGSIYIVGFEKGLREWKQYIKPGGYLVVHDDAGNIADKLRIISDSGYKLLDSFELTRDVWQTEYYGPMQGLVNEYRDKRVPDTALDNILQKEQEEIDMGLKYPENYHSAYFIMQKA